jgi:hypothetical protein
MVNRRVGPPDQPRNSLRQERGAWHPTARQKLPKDASIIAIRVTDIEFAALQAESPEAYLFPVLPKPSAPREVSLNESDHTGWGMIMDSTINCAMREPAYLQRPLT